MCHLPEPTCCLEAMMALVESKNRATTNRSLTTTTKYKIQRQKNKYDDNNMVIFFSLKMRPWLLDKSSVDP